MTPSAPPSGTTDGAKKNLDGWRAWLLANNSTVMTVPFVVLGFVLIGQSISALSF